MSSVEEKYGDILELPHFTSATHPRMPLHERAAQFSPFAALTGYEDVIRETAQRVSESGEQREGEWEDVF